MKKVLFATTALVATAGMAAAEISFDGYGRFGLFYDEGAANDTRIEQRFRLTATGTTTSDNGLEFEGRIRFETNEDAAGTSNGAQSSAAGFAVSTGGFRLDVGHVSDVVDSGDVFSYYAHEVGLTAFAGQYSGFGIPASGFGAGGDETRVAPTVKLRYTVGDFTVAASITDDAAITTTTNDFTAATSTTAVAEREEWQLGFGYNFGNYSVGAAFGNEDTTTVTTVTPFGGPAGAPTTANVDNDFWVLSFAGEIGAFAFSVLVADYDANADTSYGLSAKYDIGASTAIIFAFADSGVTGADETVALGFTHGLGGGVTLKGGVGQNTAGNTVADLGVIFNF